MFEILHKLNPFDPIRDHENCDIMLILLSKFFTNLCDYNNGYVMQFNMQKPQNTTWSNKNKEKERYINVK